MKKLYSIAIPKHDKHFRGFGALSVVVLLMVTTFAAYGQQKSAPPPSTLCDEKKVGLLNFESEAAALRTVMGEKENLLREIAQGMQKAGLKPEAVDTAISNSLSRIEMVKAQLAVPIAKALTDYLEFLLSRYQRSLDFWTEVRTHGELYGNQAFQTSLQKQTQSDLDFLKERQTFVANQIFLLRDAMTSLKCAGAAKPGSVTVRPNLSFLKDETIWDLSLKDIVIETYNGPRTQIFTLKTVGMNSGGTVYATMENVLGLIYLDENWMTMSGNKFPCDATFEGDNLKLSCTNRPDDKDLITAQFTVTVIDCVKPELNGTLRYKGGYKSGPKEWKFTGKLNFQSYVMGGCERR